MPKELLQMTVKKLSKGNVKAFDEIFLAYNKKIYSFAFSHFKSKEEAEGIVQEVFLRIWKKRTSLRTQSDFQAFLFTITYNIIKNRFRKLDRDKRHLQAYSLNVDLEDNSSKTTLEYNNLMEIFEKSLLQLPPRQREVFLLNKQEGMTVDEISKKLELSKRTVENHLFRAKAFLKKIIIDDGLPGLLFFLLFIG